MTLYKPSDQTWAYLFVLTGAFMVLTFKHFGIDTNLAAGVIGAGLQAYTAGEKTLGG
jgi:hypothetical protein